MSCHASPQGHFLFATCVMSPCLGIVRVHARCVPRENSASTLTADPGLMSLPQNELFLRNLVLNPSKH